MSLDVVVPAAGEGTRMRSNLPKPLHLLSGRPMVRWVCESARRFCDEPILVVGPESEKVTAAAGPVRPVTQHPPRGTADALARALPLCAADHLLVLYADVPLLKISTLEALLREHAAAGADVTLLTTRLPEPGAYGRIVRDADRRVKRIVEATAATEEELKIKEVFTGTAVWRRAFLLETLPRLAPDPVKGEVFLTEAVERAGRVAAVECDREEAQGVNDRVELARADAVLQRRIKEELMRSGVTIVRPETVYIEADVEIGRDTVIGPFTVIRSGVRIGEGCEVGPFSQLRGGTVLEDGAEVGNFVETKKTRMGSGAKAKHLSYLGDGVVGAGANIGAGTIFANYDGERKHATVIGEGASIGSGTVLVAPVEVGRGATTGAGAVVTRGRNVPDGGVVVGVPARPLKKRSSKRGKEDPGKRV